MSRGSGTLPVRWRESGPLRTAVGRWGGFAATAAFALYNGALGLSHASLWYGSISVYYSLMSVLRGLLLLAERQEGRTPGGISARWKRRIFYGTWGLMLVMNGALVVPVVLMVRSDRPVSMGMIPAITSATYTTYKITAAAVGLREKGGSVFAGELRILRFADALVSILVLQNTLITVVDGEVGGEMFLLSAVSSGGIFLLMFIAILALYRRGRREI